MPKLNSIIVVTHNLISKLFFLLNNLITQLIKLFFRFVKIYKHHDLSTQLVKLFLHFVKIIFKPSLSILNVIITACLMDIVVSFRSTSPLKWHTEQ